MKKLSPNDLQKLRTLQPKPTEKSIIQVALLLIGARSACRCDDEPKKFFTDVLKLFPRRLKAIHLDALEPTLYVESEVSQKDVAIVTDNMGDITPKIHNAYKRLYGYVGTAYPCSSYRDALHVSFICVASTGKTITIYSQCAKPSEVQKCYKSFSDFLVKADGIRGVKLPGFQVSYFKFSVQRMNDLFA
jgi:hypothetical protein